MFGRIYIAAEICFVTVNEVQITAETRVVTVNEIYITAGYCNLKWFHLNFQLNHQSITETYLNSPI